MKLLSISTLNHDDNVSYFDGTKLFYHKFERTKQIKRFSYDDLTMLISDIEKIWNFNINDIDEVIIDVDLSKNKPCKFENIQGKGIKITMPNISKSMWYIGHHYSHALSSWMLTKEEPHIHIVIDGLGDGRPWSVYKNNKLIAFGDIKNGSIGWGMKNAGEILNITAAHYNDIAGKVMGLQSYGNINQDFLQILRNYDINFVNVIFSPNTWYNFINNEIIQNHTMIDWIHTVHVRIGELLVDLFKKYAAPDDIITYSGGVAQNVIWNTELQKHFKNIIIPPHSSDDGTSFGGIEWLRIKNELPKFNLHNFPFIQTDTRPISNPTPETIKLAAKLLKDGKVIGWYQGNGEIGPRALGNRSILCDPRLKNSKDLVNNIKQRENYRPFGASVLEEYANEYFEMHNKDNFMLYTVNVKNNDLPGITHVDGTCRLQFVDNSNETFNTLLEEFYKITGCPILLNTSLNIAGKPLAGFPDNAKELFNTTTIDAMIIGNDVFIK